MVGGSEYCRNYIGIGVQASILKAGLEPVVLVFMLSAMMHTLNRS
jgi:hypothetical protein